ncbi:MAG TPA: efflux RND transporter permease subunit, partial [Rhizomicrobium sp.]
AFILAVLASLGVALTATPALVALMLRTHTAHADQGWIQRLKQGQDRTVSRAYRSLRLVVPVLVVLTVAAVAVLPFLPASFMPDFREGHFVMQVSSSVPGTSLDEMAAVGARISRDALALPYVATIEQQIGRASLGEDTWGTHQSEAQDALRKILARYPGLQSEVVTFLGDRISESITGETADIAIKVFGDNLDALDTAAQHITQSLRGTDGIADLQFKKQSGTPTLSLQVDRAALAASGLKLSDVLDAVQTNYSGLQVGQTYAGIRSVDVVLLLPGSQRNRPELLSALMVAGPFGPVPLSQVARVAPSESRFRVTHDGGQRYVAITFNVVGRSLQATVDDAKAKVAAIKLPPGTYVDFTGAAEAQTASRNELLLYTAFALVLIAVILAICFQWRANSWLVLVNLPFSLIGAVAAITIAGLGLTVGTMVGLVTVFGISARNAILLLAHYEHLVEVEGAPWNAETVQLGARERLVPILMTATVTALGLLPLAIGMNQPGQEIEGPMAVTVLGGLLSSTFLNLVVLPALAERFSGPKQDEAA